MSILVFGKAAFLSSIHKCPNDRFCVEGEKGVMLHKTEHSKTSDSCQGEETKQAQFFCKMYSFVLIRGLLSLCTLHSPPPSRSPASQLFQRNNALVNLFPFNS